MDRRPSPGAAAARSLYSWLLAAAVCAAAACILTSFPVHTVSPHATVVAQPFTAAAFSTAQQFDRRRQSRLDDALKREGDALVEMTDHAVNGRPVPSDFRLQWRNDFFKAKPGTFVPFTVTVERLTRPSPGALVYVRVVMKRSAETGRRAADAFAYETIFSVEPELLTERGLRIRRGFAVAPGSYTVYVALRERPADLLARSPAGRCAAVLIQDLEVPDFWVEGLSTSTVMLADRVEQLADPSPFERLEEDPYVVGGNRIHPAWGTIFRRGGELIVVFLVYNPSVTPDKHFDVQVDYHLYRKIRQGEVPGDTPGGARPAALPGERYVTRTNPQRFNPAMMGPHFDPAGGQPVLAGQGILLSGFEDGDYRLGITITDLLSRKTVSRDVAFTVIG